MKIISVVGARPNFMKVAPFVRQIEKYNKYSLEPINHILVHSGQHYDDAMSKQFFDELNIPFPDINLNIGSGSHGEQVGKTIIAFEKVLENIQPDWVIVFGDVNATIACSIASKKMHIKICHIEAGLRSNDQKMPEEINRIVTDRISDLLLVPDRFSYQNLKQEGINIKNVKLVGNIMIDTLKSNFSKANKINVKDIINKNIIKNQILNINNNNFGLLTLHRPSNVDEKNILQSIINLFIEKISYKLPIFWPIHPRTCKQLIDYDLFDRLLNCKRVILLNPLNYRNMLKLNIEAKIMFTDSGGIQEECTILKTPCLTLRANTERPITLKENGGVSILVDNDIDRINKEFELALKSKIVCKTPEYWDGKTAERCLNAIIEFN